MTELFDKVFFSDYNKQDFLEYRRK